MYLNISEIFKYCKAKSKHNSKPYLMWVLQEIKIIDENLIKLLARKVAK